MAVGSGSIRTNDRENAADVSELGLFGTESVIDTGFARGASLPHLMKGFWEVEIRNPSLGKAMRHILGSAP